MAKSKGKCNCNFLQLILAAVLMTIGLWLLVGGFAAQFKGMAMAFDTTVVVMYLVGLLFMFFGKFCFWKSHGMCSVHNK